MSRIIILLIAGVVLLAAFPFVRADVARKQTDCLYIGYVINKGKYRFQDIKILFALPPSARCLPGRPGRSNTVPLAGLAARLVLNRDCMLTAIDFRSADDYRFCQALWRRTQSHSFKCTLCRLTSAGAGGDKHSATGERHKGIGRVVWVKLEGGFWGIEFADKKLRPVNLPEQFQQPGLVVVLHFEYLEPRPGIHMWGIPVRIIEMRCLRNCKNDNRRK